jgi:YVTN family beta-propeller protein
VGVSRTAIVLITLCSAACAAAPGPDRLAYVSNETGGEIAVIDFIGGRVVDRIAVGKRPRGLRVSPDGKFLWVALSGSPIAGPKVDPKTLPPADRSADGIGVIDLATRKLIKRLDSGQDPETFDVFPDGGTLYVSNEETAELSAIDSSSGEIRGHVHVGNEPEGVTVHPDGKTVFVTCEGDNAVVAVDASTMMVRGAVATGPRPRSIAFSPDGRIGFVTTENVASVTTFDPATLIAGETIAVPKTEGAPTDPRPMGTAMLRDGRLLVTNGRAQSLSIIGVNEHRVLAMVERLGERPWGVAVDGSGRIALTANGGSGDVSVIDLETRGILRRIPIGGSPWGVAVAKPN